MTSLIPTTPTNAPALSMTGMVLISRRLIVSTASDSMALSFTYSTGVVMISQTLTSLRDFMSAAISIRAVLETMPVIFFPLTTASCLQLLVTMYSAIFVISVSSDMVGRLDTRDLILVSGVALFFLSMVP